MVGSMSRWPPRVGAAALIASAGHLESSLSHCGGRWPDRALRTPSADHAASLGRAPAASQGGGALAVSQGRGPTAPQRHVRPRLAGDILAARRRSPPPEGRQRKEREDSSAVDARVGPISETKAHHLERHGGGRQAWPRCRYYQMGERWARAYGHLDESLLCAAGPRGTVWLAEKPAH